MNALETYRQQRAIALKIKVEKYGDGYVATSPKIDLGDYCSANSHRAARNRLIAQIDGSNRPQR